ncbi:MAG TPA: AAA family ATPase [Candidatus Paceibacterota bacterium]|nr:AAA family ATPase [Candidatus Paceibacterota bacterium]
MRQVEALEILKSGANVFLTGEPGSGKTHTIMTYVAYLRDHGIIPALTASTGIAATHIHGQTIHSWSGIGIRRSLSPYDLDHMASTEYLVRRIAHTAVLIIDEVSMIDAATLAMVDTVCRTLRQKDAPFGGMQIVMVGDFFQLPPVGKSEEETRFAFDANVWHELQPVVCYLTEQFRHTDEQLFSVLKAIRNNTYDHTHHRVLARRLVEKDVVLHSDQLHHVPRLFSRNVDVDVINAEALSKLPSAPMVYFMVEKGKKSLVASLKKGCLSPERLELKVNAVVMCTKNNPSGGYANGTLGVVVGFEPATKYPIIETRDGTRITITPLAWVVEEEGKQRASITQIPLRLAWAMTIHKSQGMSLDAAIMDLGEVFAYGQGYVALSRVRSLEGVYLTGWSDRALDVHPRMHTIDAQFVQQSQAAAAIFGDLPKSELETMQRNFILASGGTLATEKSTTRAAKPPTLDATLMFILQGKSIAEIARLRSLAATTILGHIEKLVAAKRLHYEDIAHCADPVVAAGVGDIKKAFIAHDTSKLAPLYDQYKGRYTYNQLRLARVLIAAGFPQ